MWTKTVETTTYTHTVWEQDPELRGKDKLEVAGQTFSIWNKIDISTGALKEILSFDYTPQAELGRDEADGVTGTIVSINYR